MTKIGMILENKYPPDIRVDKEIKMLCYSGHKVFLLCLGEDRFGDIVRKDGVNIRYIKGRTPFFINKLEKLSFYLTFYYPYWSQECKKFVKDFQVDALHVHDLPLLKTVYTVARKFGIPIVADLHENYSVALQEWHGSWLRKVTLYNKRHWQKYEAGILKKVTSIITVVDESKRYLLDYGLPSEKITIIPNVVDPDFLEIPIMDEVTDRFQPYFLISYIGGFGPHRGLETAILAMDKIRKYIPNAHLLLVGKGPSDYVRKLEGLVQQLDLSGYIEFTGWQPFSTVPSYIKASHICLVPYNSGLQTDASAPHKLFQYWIMKKPVLASSCLSLKRIIDSSKGGLVFAAGNPDDMVHRVLELYENPELRTALGENGYKSIITGLYSWNETSNRLNNIYHQLK